MKRNRGRVNNRKALELCVVTCLFMIEWHVCSETIGTVGVIDVSGIDLEGMAEERMGGGVNREVWRNEGMWINGWLWETSRHECTRRTQVSDWRAMKRRIYLTFSWELFFCPLLSISFLFLSFPMAGMSCVGFICHDLLVAMNMRYWCEVCVFV